MSIIKKIFNIFSSTQKGAIIQENETAILPYKIHTISPQANNDIKFLFNSKGKIQFVISNSNADCIEYIFMNLTCSYGEDFTHEHKVVASILARNDSDFYTIENYNSLVHEKNKNIKDFNTLINSLGGDEQFYYNLSFIKNKTKGLHLIKENEKRVYHLVNLGIALKGASNFSNEDILQTISFNDLKSMFSDISLTAKSKKDLISKALNTSDISTRIKNLNFHCDEYYKIVKLEFDINEFLQYLENKCRVADDIFFQYSKYKSQSIDGSPKIINNTTHVDQ